MGDDRDTDAGERDTDAGERDTDAGARLRAAEGRMPALIVGERLCLDFANTVEPRGGPDHGADPPSREYLTGYGDLVAWAARVGVLDEEGAVRFLGEAGCRPAAARAVFARAIALREAIYRAFWAVGQGQAPRPDDLGVLTREHRAATDHAALVAAEDGFAWAWTGDGDDEGALDRPLWPVATSATALLTAGELGRVKVCPGAPGEVVPCAWLFYDESRNRTRRWCSMADCGSAAKARQLTARRRTRRAEGRM